MKRTKYYAAALAALALSPIAAAMLPASASGGGYSLLFSLFYIVGGSAVGFFVPPVLFLVLVVFLCHRETKPRFAYFVFVAAYPLVPMAAVIAPIGGAFGIVALGVLLLVFLACSFPKAYAREIYMRVVLVLPLIAVFALLLMASLEPPPHIPGTYPASAATLLEEKRALVYYATIFAPAASILHIILLGALYSKQALPVHGPETFVPVGIIFFYNALAPVIGSDWRIPYFSAALDYAEALAYVPAVFLVVPIAHGLLVIYLFRDKGARVLRDDCAERVENTAGAR
jgi:hypothetical protein